MQVTPSAIIPILMPQEQATAYPPGDPEAPVVEEYYSDMAVAYSAGPPYGQRLVTNADLDMLGLGQRGLRRAAAANLQGQLDRVEIHGLPPVFTLSFDGLESTLLLSDEVWNSLADQVDGETVIGAPARDVLFVTGSRSQPGLEKIHRACERIFFAGHDNLLSRHLMVRRNGGWELF